MHLGFWNGLGGKIEEDESPVENVIREIKEESGLTIRDPSLKGIITYPNNLGRGETWYVFIFVAKKFTGELCNDCDEGTLAWIPKDQLLDLKLHDSDLYFLPWLERPGVFEASFIYEGEKVVKHRVTWHGEVG